MPKKEAGRLIVRKLRFHDSTEHGQFYVVIGGKVICEEDRSFWPSKSAARASGLRFLTKVLGRQSQ